MSKPNSDTGMSIGAQLLEKGQNPIVQEKEDFKETLATVRAERIAAALKLTEEVIISELDILDVPSTIREIEEEIAIRDNAWETVNEFQNLKAERAEVIKQFEDLPSVIKNRAELKRLWNALYKTRKGKAGLLPKVPTHGKLSVRYNELKAKVDGALSKGTQDYDAQIEILEPMYLEARKITNVENKEWKSGRD